jgi:hypothetical protein
MSSNQESPNFAEFNIEDLLKQVSNVVIDEDPRKEEFVKAFDNEHDRYLAHSLFDEKPLLSIEECSDDEYHLAGIEKKGKELLFCVVYDTGNYKERFYIESFLSLPCAINLCNYFGFNFTIYLLEQE